MIHKIKQIIFTDKNKDGKELINAAKKKFFMLHIQLDDDTWVSKYYTNDDKKQKLLSELEIGKDYDFQIKESGIYKNIVQVSKGDYIII